jgi:superfamily II DNA or RNA helicase
MVINAANHLINLKCKPLVIVNHIEHMETLHRMFNTIGIKSKMASGNMGASDRAKSLKDLGRGRLDTIVCTNIFDEGIDVKEVGGVVMAAGTKSAPAFMQRTGRAIRKKDGNNRAVVIDFIDYQHPMLLKHSRQRLDLVNAEDEFVLLNHK